MSFSGCRHEGEDILQPDSETKGEIQKGDISGFYLLNEGNMGSNKSTLDYYDYTIASYQRNIFPMVNPDVVQGLGDVGNDLKIYGNRLYAVINCSNLIEVMDARTAKHIGTIEIANARYLTFKAGYGYVTSYAGPISLDKENKQIGYVAKFDTATLRIVDTCHVGFQPDGLGVVGTKLYVANSGGYLFPDYETTVSVIDLVSFTEQGRIAVAPNLNFIQPDYYGQVWVSSRGDYALSASRLYCLDSRTDRVIDSVSIPVSTLWLDGDSLYVMADNSFIIINTLTRQVVSERFITDGTTFFKPYGLAVHPLTKDIYVTDANTYVNPGTLYCFDPQGKQRWSVMTGDVPAHIAFLYGEGKMPKEDTTIQPQPIENPYISKVYAYRPGMGQFVNMLPKYETGDDEVTMCRKCEKAIADNNRGTISLGGFGGYIVFGFDHSVINQAGADFRIEGNAFSYSDGLGNSEPGIVQVSVDVNKNGVPDDPWYELAGSEYSATTTIRNYSIIYKREADTARNIYHQQPYYPQWLTEGEYTLTGTKIASYQQQVGGNWVSKILNYGYVDNAPNADTAANSFDIDWAVDEEGKSVLLNHVDFIKVYTAVEDGNPTTGEVSTEICGAIDL